MCAENFLYYRSADLASELRVVIPRRSDLDPERSVLLTSFASFKNKRVGFFFLVQSEYGDLYKVRTGGRVQSGRKCSANGSSGRCRLPSSDGCTQPAPAVVERQPQLGPKLAC